MPLHPRPEKSNVPTHRHPQVQRHQKQYPGHRRGRLRHNRPTLYRRPIVAVIPARNEPTIGDTVRSLFKQTLQPSRVFVVANNCTDDGLTSSEARQAGAIVINLDNNPHLKAGAINFGLDAIQTYYPEGECGILIMDADTILSETWVHTAEKALRHADAVSGAYHGREEPGILGLLQQTEFAQAAHRSAQHPLRVSVLSGTASMFRMSALRRIRDARKSGDLDGPATFNIVRPDETVTGGGPISCWYNIRSIVEDYELTLALRKLGMAIVAPPTLRVTTDVMTSWRDLWRQRVRWQEGTLRTLPRFPITVTWRAWLVQTWIYAIAISPFVVIALTALASRGGQLEINPWWLLVTPVVGLAEAWSARSGGRRCIVFAALVLPMWLMGFFRIAVYYFSAFRAIRSAKMVWHEG